MDYVALIQAAAVGINALLGLIAKLRANSGLTDDQIAALFDQHGPETTAAIQGYLAALPPAA